MLYAKMLVCWHRKNLLHKKLLGAEVHYDQFAAGGTGFGSAEDLTNALSSTITDLAAQDDVMELVP